MPETPARRSALAAIYRVGGHGADWPEGPGVTLFERRGLALVHLAGRVGDRGLAEAAGQALGLALPLAANTAAYGPELTVFWHGPGRWLVESRVLGGEEIARRLRERAPGAAVVDVSGGRTVLRVAGLEARRTLAKGCPIDLHPSAFPPGAVALSALDGIAVMLHALPALDTLDLYVARSFAQHVFEWLLHAAAEHGCRIDASWA